MVAHPLRLALVNDSQNPVNLFSAEYLREVTASLRRFKKLSRVLLYFALKLQKLVKTAHSAQYARKAAGRDVRLTQSAGKLVQLCERHRAEIVAVVVIIFRELLQVAHIGIESVRRETALEFEVLGISLYDVRANHVLNHKDKKGVYFCREKTLLFLLFSVLFVSLQ